MTIFVPGTLSPDDSQLLVMGTKVFLLAKKELLENAKFDFRSVEGLVNVLNVMLKDLIYQTMLEREHLQENAPVVSSLGLSSIPSHF